MTAASPPLVDFGWRAPALHLADTKGKVWTLEQLRGPKDLLLTFICNHCDYVHAIVDKLAREGRELHDMGFGVAAICSNDAAAYPEDGYEAMGAFARAHHLPFPYLHDDSQDVALAYNAICTPDFFLYDGERKLYYAGQYCASMSPVCQFRQHLLYQMLRRRSSRRYRYPTFRLEPGPQRDDLNTRLPDIIRQRVHETVLAIHK